MIRISWLNATILITIFLISKNSLAISCNAPSPNLIDEGDQYYEIEEAKPLTRKQKSAINNLFSSLKNRDLTGTNITTECEGTEANAHKVTTKGTLTGDISLTSDGRVTMSLIIYNSKNKTSLNETLEFFGSNNQYTIQDYSNKNLTLVSKLRKRRGKYSASILHEEIIDIHLDNGALIITTTRYINGYFAVDVNRSLK